MLSFAATSTSTAPPTIPIHPNPSSALLGEACTTENPSTSVAVAAPPSPDQATSSLWMVRHERGEFLYDRAMEKIITIDQKLTLLTSTLLSWEFWSDVMVVAAPASKAAMPLGTVADTAWERWVFIGQGWKNTWYKQTHPFQHLSDGKFYWRNLMGGMPPAA